MLPLNSAINPVLYTISTAQFMRNIRKKASRFKKSFTGSLRSSDTKHSFIGKIPFGNHGNMSTNVRMFVTKCVCINVLCPIVHLFKGCVLSSDYNYANYILS